MGSPILGDISAAAIEQFGVQPSLVDEALGTPRVPRTRTRTSHGLTIRVVGGPVIGACFGFTEQVTRDLEDAWEIDANATGYRPVDIVPGNVSGRSLRIDRYDLFTQVMEEVLGSREVVVLSDQTRPFVLRTHWQSPVGALLGGRRIYQYEDCWFASMGRVARADDTRLVGVNAEIRYGLRRRVL